jgi:hypothetical protein
MHVDVISIKACRFLFSTKLCAAVSDVAGYKSQAQGSAHSRERPEHTLRNVG